VGFAAGAPPVAEAPGACPGGGFDCCVQAL